MVSKKDFKVYNIVSYTDNEPLFEDKKLLKSSPFFLEYMKLGEDELDFPRLLQQLNENSYDICFYHPNDWEVSIGSSDTLCYVVIYSGEYDTIEWLTDRIVKMPRSVVFKLSYEIVKEMQRSPSTIFKDLVNNMIVADSYGRTDSDGPHKKRNRFGPATFAELMVNDGLKISYGQEYFRNLENCKPVNVEGQSTSGKKRYLTSSKLPFNPGDLKVFSQSQFSPRRILIIDDDHRRGWSTLLTAFINGSSMKLYEIEPNLTSDSSYEFKKYVTDYSSEKFMSIWELSEVIEEKNEFAVAIQQVGKKLPLPGGRSSKSDISAVNALFSRDDSRGIKKELLPFDLAFIDYRAQNEIVEVKPDDVSGNKIVKLLREIDPSLPVIVFTASANVNTLLALNKYDIIGYYIKPSKKIYSDDYEKFRDLKKQIKRAEEYWPIRLIWGASCCIANKDFLIREEFISDESREYFYSYSDMRSHKNNNNFEDTFRTYIVEILEELVGVAVGWRSKSDISFSTSASNFTIFNKLGLLGGYLYPDSSLGVQNPGSRIYKEPIFYYCEQVSRSIRNIVAHKFKEILDSNDLVIQVMVTIYCFLESDFPYEVARFVPAMYAGNNLDIDMLMQQFKNFVLSNHIDYADGTVRGGSIANSLHMQLHSHLTLLNEEDVLVTLDSSLDSYLDAHIQMKKNERKPFLLTLVQNFIKRSEIPDLMLIFCSFTFSKRENPNTILLLCANYLLLAKQIELSRITSNSLKILHGLLLYKANEIIENHISAEESV